MFINPEYSNGAEMDLSNTHMLDDAVVTTKIDAVVNWGREASLWPFVFGTACCAIEFMATAASRYDISRFGAEVLRFSPRHADLLVVAGTVSYKQAPILKQIWDQMPEPKWCVAVGACASTGGFYDNYTTLQGIDEIVPVDVYVAGCPPRPEAILDAVMDIQRQLKREPKFEVRNTEFKGKLDDV
jgi:NADH-quinone oxidoreductase subunit B